MLARNHCYLPCLIADCWYGKNIIFENYSGNFFFMKMNMNLVHKMFYAMFVLGFPISLFIFWKKSCSSGGPINISLRSKTVLTLCFLVFFFIFYPQVFIKIDLSSQDLNRLLRYTELILHFKNSHHIVHISFFTVSMLTILIMWLSWCDDCLNKWY